MTTRAGVLGLAPRRIWTPRAAGGVREVALLAGPAVLQTLSDTVLSIVDMAIVARLGSAELGGVGFGGLWLWTTLSLFVGTASGLQTFVARALGDGEGASKGRWLWQAAWALVPAVSIWMLVVAWRVEAVFSWLAPGSDLLGPASEYTLARLAGGPAIVGCVLMASFFRGLGDTRTPLVAALAANSVNVVLSWALVLGEFGFPAWGPAGAGVSTSVANWIALGVLSAVLFRGRRRREHGTFPPCRPDLWTLFRFLRTSLPVGAQWFLDLSSFAIFSTVIARMGTESAAANQAMIQILSLSFMQASGIAIAAGSLVGRYVGARNFEAAVRTHHSAQLLALLLAGGLAMLFLAAPQALLGVFSPAEAVLELGRPLILLGALFQLVDARVIIVAGVLRGAGDTRWPFLAQTASAWLFRIPLLYFLAVFLEGGVLGAWKAELLHIVFVTILLHRRFRSGAWQDLAL